ncbi:hypothetical protein ILUMI_22909, partial [Ignelater luminosus]
MLLEYLSVFFVSTTLLRSDHGNPGIVGWEASISRNTSEYVFPNTTSILIKPDDLCESPTFLMVIVCSAPYNFEARKAIRKSWGLERNISGNAVSVYFILGKLVRSSLQ